MYPRNLVGYIHTVFLFLALAHSCINPFVYFWMNTRVRNRAKINVKKCMTTSLSNVDMQIEMKLFSDTSWFFGAAGWPSHGPQVN